MSETTKLEKLLAELPTVRAPAGWKERVRASIDAGTPPEGIGAPVTHRPLWIAGGALVAAAAAIAIYLAIDTSSPGSAPSIEVRVTRNTSSQVAMRDRTTASVGDTIVIEAHGAAALRVYRDRTQLARCPGHTGCVRDPDGFVLSLEVTASGPLSAIAYTPALPEPGPTWQPSASDLDSDIALAVRMQIKMTSPASVDVP